MHNDTERQIWWWWCSFAGLVWEHESEQSWGGHKRPRTVKETSRFAKEVAHSGGNISTAWTDWQKTWYNTVSKKMCNELATVAGSDVDEWKCLILGQILDTFSVRDIYNAGDTGLFWKALPECSLFPST